MSRHAEHGHGHGGDCCAKEPSEDDLPPRMRAPAMGKKAETEAASHDHGHGHAAHGMALMANGINCGGCKKALDAAHMELSSFVLADLTCHFSE